MNLKSLINEELNKLLINETKEYADNEIINHDDINLSDEYNKLNRQLFNGKLLIVPLKWSNRKTSLGHVRLRFNRETGEAKILYLAISSFYSTPYWLFKNTLAHEMIHVETYSTGMSHFGGKHGFHFQNEANRINSMNIGYKITAVNSEELEVSNKTKENMKTLIAMLIDLDGTYYLSVTTPNVFNADIDSVLSLYEKLVNNGKYNNVEITAVESKNPKLMSFPIQRSYRSRISYARLSDELLGELLENNIIKSAKFKRGVPKVVSEDNTSNDAGDWVTFDVV
jgi:hypothetical protein